MKTIQLLPQNLHLPKQETNKKLPLFLFCVTFIVLISTHSWTIRAQAASSPSLRDTLIQTIQQKARHDVDMDKPPENATGLKTLFGDEAETAGISIREVMNI